MPIALSRSAEPVSPPPGAVTRLTRRGLAMVAGGLLLPVVAFVVVGMLVTPPPGMDGYVPAFLGGMAGAAVGFVVILVGIVSLLKARSLRRISATTA